MVQWWTNNTLISPNWNEIARKRIGPWKWNEKPIHFFIELQVPIHPWANAWLGVSLLAPMDSLEFISFFAYKVESFFFLFCKFFVVYEEQLNQKNYNITF
jgi:hypothetical protein